MVEEQEITVSQIDLSKRFKFLIEVVLSEIIDECDRIIFISKDLNRFLSPPQDMKISEFFNFLRYLLIHSAMISKYIWPNPRSYDLNNKKNKRTEQQKVVTKQRKDFMERLFGDKENMKSLSDKIIRNYLEHLDENLDDWSMMNVAYFKNICIPESGKGISGISEDKIFNLYKKKERMYRILDVEVNIQSVLDDVMKIKDIAKKAEENIREERRRKV